MNTDGAYQIPMSEALLPNIPVQPIGYDEAEVLFRYSNQSSYKQISFASSYIQPKKDNFLRAIKEGQRAPTEWQGDLDVDYFLGPELKNGWKIKMEIHTANKVATIHNTIAILNGEEEPGKLK